METAPGRHHPHRADITPTESALRRWLAQAGLSDALGWVFGPVRQGLAARWEDEASGVLVEVIGPQVATYNDRGGTAAVPAQAGPRTQPRRMTEMSLSVGYWGVVKMCCNVIPDSAPEHERYVVGSAAEATLSELWNSEAMTTSPRPARGLVGLAGLPHLRAGAAGDPPVSVARAPRARDVATASVSGRICLAGTIRRGSPQ